MFTKSVEEFGNFHAANWDNDPHAVIKAMGKFAASSEQEQLDVIKIAMSKPIPEEMRSDMVNYRAETISCLLEGKISKCSLELKLAVWDAVLTSHLYVILFEGMEEVIKTLDAYDDTSREVEPAYTEEEIGMIVERAIGFIAKVDDDAFKVVDSDVIEEMLLSMLEIAPREDLEQAVVEKLVDFGMVRQLGDVLPHYETFEQRERVALHAINYLATGEMDLDRCQKIDTVAFFARAVGAELALDRAIEVLKANVYLDVQVAILLSQLGKKGVASLMGVDHKHVIEAVSRLHNADPVTGLTVLFGLRAKQVQAGVNDLDELDSKIRAAFVTLTQEDYLAREISKNGIGPLKDVFVNAANAGMTVEKLVAVAREMLDAVIKMREAKDKMVIAQGKLVALNGDPFGTFFPRVEFE